MKIGDFYLPGGVVVSALPPTQESVSSVNNADVSALVSVEVINPSSSPRMVLRRVVAKGLISLCFQLGDKSGDGSNNSIYETTHALFAKAAA